MPGVLYRCLSPERRDQILDMDDEDGSRCDEEKKMIEPWTDKHGLRVTTDFFGSYLVELD